MPIVIACSHCQARLKLADTQAGKNVKCPKCGKVFKAVADAAEEAAVRPEAAGAKEAKLASGPPPLPMPPPRPVAAVSDADAPRRPVRRPRDDDEDDDEEERPRRSRRNRKEKS